MNAQHPAELILCQIGLRYSSVSEAKTAHDLIMQTVECTMSKRGCQECSLALDSSDPAQLRYCERWQTGNCFRRHVGSREFRHVLSAIDMCSAEPDIRIEKRISMDGMDCLKTVYQEGIDMLRTRVSD